MLDSPAGTDNSFYPTTLLGAVNATGLASGTAWNESTSTLLVIIEGEGILTFQYQFAPETGETATLYLNGAPIRNLGPQVDTWRQVTMNFPAGTHELQFIVQARHSEKLTGQLHLDNITFSGENVPEEVPQSTDENMDVQDAEDVADNADTGASVWDQILNGDNITNNNSDNNDAGNNDGTNVWDAILGDNASDNDDPTDDSSDAGGSDSIFDQVLGGTPDNSDMSGASGEQSNAATGGDDLGESISNLIQEAADYVVESIINPILEMIQSIFDQFVSLLEN